MKIAKFLALGLIAAYALSSASAFAASDGAKLFKRKCAACHSIKDGKNKIGPSLYNVIGRKAGSYSTFKRYRALKGASFVWNEDNISKWITNPRKFIGKSTAMSIRVKKESDRKAILAYLKAN